MTDAEMEDAWITYFMQIKSSYWSYENEYRIIRPLDTLLRVGDITKLRKKTDHGALFELPPDAIRNVILGMKSSHSLKESVQAVLAESRYKHVQLKYAELDDKDYALVLRNA